MYMSSDCLYMAPEVVRQLSRQTESLLATMGGDNKSYSIPLCGLYTFFRLNMFCAKSRVWPQLEQELADCGRFKKRERIAEQDQFDMGLVLDQTMTKLEELRKLVESGERLDVNNFQAAMKVAKAMHVKVRSAKKVKTF